MNATDEKDFALLQEIARNIIAGEMCCDVSESRRAALAGFANMLASTLPVELEDMLCHAMLQVSMGVRLAVAFKMGEFPQNEEEG